MNYPSVITFDLILQLVLSLDLFNYKKSLFYFELQSKMY